MAPVGAGLPSCSCSGQLPQKILFFHYGGFFWGHQFKKVFFLGNRGFGSYARMWGIFMDTTYEQKTFDLGHLDVLRSAKREREESQGKSRFGVFSIVGKADAARDLAFGKRKNWKWVENLRYLSHEGVEGSFEGLEERVKVCSFSMDVADLEYLCSVGILGAPKREQKVRATGRLSSVGKADGGRRLIFDGREGNKLMKKVSPFGLTSMEHAASVAGRFRKGVRADKVNWFYQFSVGDFAASLTVMIINGKRFVLKVLAMGSKFAPVTGQTFTALEVLYKEDGEDDLGARWDCDDIPANFPLYRKETLVGWIIIHIDNVFVFSNDEGLVEQWRVRLLRNATVFRTVWKYVEYFDSDIEGVTVLGLEVGSKGLRPIPRLIPWGSGRNR